MLFKAQLDLFPSGLPSAALYRKGVFLSYMRAEKMHHWGEKTRVSLFVTA